MYAVVKTGGKQYRVAKDDIIKIERLPGEAGDTITLGDVLMVGEGDNVTVGAPLVDGASVAGEILEQGRAKKVVIFKKRRRQNYRRKKGHRQHLTVLKVTDILTGGAKAKPAKKAEPKKEAPKKEAASGGADDLKKLLSGVGPALEKKAPRKLASPASRRLLPGAPRRSKSLTKSSPSRVALSAKIG